MQEAHSLNKVKWMENIATQVDWSRQQGIKLRYFCLFDWLVLFCWFSFKDAAYLLGYFPYLCQVWVYKMGGE